MNDAFIPPAAPDPDPDPRPVPRPVPEQRPVAGSSAPSASAPRPAASAPPPSGFDRALGALRVAVPLVRRLLPLLDGNIGTAVSNFIPSHAPAPPLPPPPDLELIENELAVLHQDQAELRDGQHSLRGLAVEQTASLQALATSLQRVEEQLELISLAADRTALAQQELRQELIDELKAGRKRSRAFAWTALGLLAISIACNGFLIFWLLRPGR